jgi:hypothetical protein
MGRPGAVHFQTKGRMRHSPLLNPNGNESVSSEPRMSIVKFIFRAFQIAGKTIRSSYCLLALAAMIAGGGVIAFS